MGTTRKRRPWTSRAEGQEPEGFPQWEHSSLTPEGEIERVGTIARNIKTAPRWARLVALLIAVTLLLPVAVLLTLNLVQVLRP